MKFSIDCVYFKGDRPCQYHKKLQKRCRCQYYRKIDKRILIIKLGAAGDVIRTTPILRKLKEVYPNCQITWITYTPEILPREFVDFSLMMDGVGILKVLADRFDILYNFDKDKEACALANLVKAKVKKGFRLHMGRCFPFHKDAERKFATGLDDVLNMENRFTYPQEIFQIAGFLFNKERYVIEKKVFTKDFLLSSERPIIGLNTGCGRRWLTRRWPLNNWIKLAKKFKEENFNVLLLGGEMEDSLNRKIAQESGAVYLGHFSLSDFIGLIDRCDLIVTTVTMALHIAIGLEKKIVLLNNIFNRYEFELYGLGEIIEPPVPCKGCYKEDCEKQCMELVAADDVYSACVRLISKSD